jgi:hypothetical protein
MPARTLSLILGLWLFVSAFAFQRPPPAFTNAWVVGLAAALAAITAMTRAPARYANTALAAWLVVSAFALPHRSPASFWHDVAMGLVMLLLSLVPGTIRPMPRRAEAAAAR